MSRAQRVKVARAVAVAADLLELAVFPAFFEGALSPANDLVDLAVAGVLTWLLGWHWAFLPAFAAELVPFVTLVPTWTAAVLFVTRARDAGVEAASETARPHDQPRREA